MYYLSPREISFEIATDLRRLARLLCLLDDVLEGADVLVDAAELLHVRHLLCLQLLELGAVLGQALLLLLHRVHVDQQRDPRLLQVYRFMADVLQSFQLGESLPFINTGHGGAAVSVLAVCLWPGCRT